MWVFVIVCILVCFYLCVCVCALVSPCRVQALDNMVEVKICCRICGICLVSMATKDLPAGRVFCSLQKQTAQNRKSFRTECTGVKRNVDTEILSGREEREKLCAAPNLARSRTCAHGKRSPCREWGRGQCLSLTWSSGANIDDLTNNWGRFVVYTF